MHKNYSFESTDVFFSMTPAGVHTTIVHHCCTTTLQLRYNMCLCVKLTVLLQSCWFWITAGHPPHFQDASENRFGSFLRKWASLYFPTLCTVFIREVKSSHHWPNRPSQITGRLENINISESWSCIIISTLHRLNQGRESVLRRTQRIL